ncbi:MAG: hypothetical protein ACYSU7_12820 [Planctomycetota bacterium]
MKHSSAWSPTRTGASLLMLAAMAAALGGCSVYSTRYVYEPEPADVESARPGADEADPAQTLVTIVGVRRADERSQLPASVEVRLQLNNTSPFPVTFDPATLALTGGGSDRFPDPIVRPEGVVTLAPQDTAVVDAFFPFPAGRSAEDLDLSALDLQWIVKLDGDAVASSAGFTVLPTGYYDRYPRRVGVGYQRYDAR